MNGPYFRNHPRSVPVQQPKVVSIPVHFISSHHQPQTKNISTSRHSSALKIQKVFKGHKARKALNKIVSIKNQVNEIEKRLQNDVVFVNLLRNDAKERLRVSETLMSLLFKLDSVRGVENGVREVRKSVAKKAVALQEKVDSIAQTFEHDDVSNDEKTELCDVSDGVRNKANQDVVDDDVSRNDQNSESVQNHVVDDVSNDEKTRCCDVSNGVRNEVNEEEDVVDDDVSKNDQNSESVDDQELVANEAMKECDDDVISNNNVQNHEFVENEEDVKECVENHAADEGSVEKCDDDVSKSFCDHEMVVNDDRQEGGGDDDVSKRFCDEGMVEAMEKLKCDNAKMMKLMIQISERNEMQTRMINSLSKRVDHLEKAFIMSDNKSRRKRRNKSYTRKEKDSFCI
ncbi:BAG family molecular chaperone regulator 6-like protein [Tanacetum coccineum]